MRESERISGGRRMVDKRERKRERERDSYCVLNLYLLLTNLVTELLN